MNAWMRLRRAWDRLTIYLPLVVMAVLALGSWWLVRSMPDLWTAAKTQTVRKDPDYELRQFVVKVFDAKGHLVREIIGDEGRHYPDTDELHIEQVTFEARDTAGQHLHAVARKGIATGDGTRVTLLGNAHVLRETPQQQNSRMELRGEKLVALIKEEKLLSSDPVQITRGADVFNAKGMNFNMAAGHYELTGRVQGMIAPASRSKP